jgi:7-carboxy-7-deazaguanine synthase
MAAVLTVNEIFHSIQGESTRAGLPCVFIRLTGCNLRCRWCDTAYAFHEGSSMSRPDILREVAAHGCRLVEVTGGEPLLQPEARDLMRDLVDAGYTVLLETGGSLPLDGIPDAVVRIVDVKCPGSGEATRNHWANLDSLRAHDEVKFVIADRADYEWARSQVTSRGLASRCAVLFSAVHGGLDAGTMAGWILADGLDVRVQIQLHKLLWPGVERGV